MKSSIPFSQAVCGRCICSCISSVFAAMVTLYPPHQCQVFCILPPIVLRINSVSSSSFLITPVSFILKCILRGFITFYCLNLLPSVCSPILQSHTVTHHYLFQVLVRIKLILILSSYPCQKPHGKICTIHPRSLSFTSPVNNLTYPIETHAICSSRTSCISSLASSVMPSMWGT